MTRTDDNRTNCVLDPTVVIKRLPSLVIGICLVAAVVFSSASTAQAQIVFCGDGLCTLPDETCETCPQDCGPCSVCGDGECEDPEDCLTCPEDCGLPPVCDTQSCLDLHPDFLAVAGNALIFTGTDDDEIVVFSIRTVKVPAEDPCEECEEKEAIWISYTNVTTGDSWECFVLADDIESIIAYGLGGDDFIDGSLMPDDFALIFYGDEGDDILITGAGDDAVYGGPGDDIIITDGGDDTANGGPGNDIILTGDGDDGAGDLPPVTGGPGCDYIYGGVGDDVIEGGGGEAEDECLLEPKDRHTWTQVLGEPLPGWYPRTLPDYFCDVIFGGVGNDVLIGGDGVNYILGGPVLPPEVDIEDDDIIAGGPSTDYLFGGAKDDVINGGGGSNLIVGNAGDDALRGGGLDVIDYMWDGGPVGVSIDLAINEGNPDPDENATDTWGTRDTVVGFSVIRGSMRPDSLIGNARGSTVIMGMGGPDFIMGGVNTDFLFGTPQSDRIDACGSQNPNTSEDEFGACWELTDGLEDAGDLVIGGAGNDVIRGFMGDDVLFGDGDPLYSPIPNQGFFTPMDTNGNGIPDFLLGEPNPLDPSMPVNIRILDVAEIALYQLVDPTTGEFTQKVMPTLPNGSINPIFAVGSDFVQGYLGDDIIVGGLGSDTLGDPAGGISFKDLPDSDANYKLVDGEPGMDYIWGGLHIPLGKPPFFPDDAYADNDVIGGGGDPDLIYGCGGLDTIYGENSQDALDGYLLFVDSEYDYFSDTIYGDYDYDYLDRNGNVLPRWSFGSPWYYGGTMHNDGIWEIDPTNPTTLAIYSDNIFGGLGDDEIYGGAGNDFLVGGMGEDYIQGNAGSDMIRGGSMIGSDYRDFSPRDTLDYSTASQWLHQGVQVILGGMTEATGQTFVMGRGYDGEGGVDTIYGIENVIGSDFDDVLIGSTDTLTSVRELIRGAPSWAYAYFNPTIYAYAPNTVFSPKDYYGYQLYQDAEYSGQYTNILLGRQGNDVIMGRGGEDLLVGGQGDDIICGDTDIHCDPGGPYLTHLTSYFALNLRPEDAVAGHNDMLLGGYGNDKLYGNGGNDHIRGGPGADLLSGGVGTYDVLDYSDLSALYSVVVNLRNEPVDLKQYEEETVSDPTILPFLPSSLTPLPLSPCSNVATVQCANSATDGGDLGQSWAIPAIAPVPRMVDTIVNSPADDPASTLFDESLDRFEVVLGTSGTDVIFGAKNKPCMLIGWSGDDFLVGGNATTGLTDGWLYHNVIYGDAPDNTDLAAVDILPPDMLATIIPGNDVIESGSGDDKLDGGGQPYLGKGDFVSYAHASGFVNVSLADTQMQNTGSAGTDTILRFENLIGSNYVGPTGGGDVLVGNAFNNLILGKNGDDKLTGGPGNDTLMGGPGQDTADYQSCVSCSDPATFSYSESLGGYFVGDDGQGGNDVLAGIERVLSPAGPIALDAGDDSGDTGGAQIPAPQVKVVLGVVGELQVTEPGGQVSIPFSASGGVAPYTAKWDPTTDTDPNIPNRKITILTYAGGTFAANQIQTAVASPVKTTTYRVTVTDSQGSTQSAFVKVRVAGAFSVFAGADRVITSGQQVLLRPTVTGGVAPYTFAWAVQGIGDGGFISATNIAAVTVAPTATTVYVVTVVDSLGSQITDSVTVTVFSLDGDGNPAGTDNTGQPGDDQTGNDNGGTDVVPGDGDDDQNPPSGDDDQDDDAAQEIPPRTFGFPICGAGVNLTMVMVSMLLMAAMKRREW